MKIRNGFVSNSSSSSFLIYGICMEQDELLDLLNVSEEEKESGDSCDFDDMIYEKANKLGLEFYNPDGYDGCYIGRSWSEVGDDETGKQFKDKIEADLKSIFGDKLEFGTFEEAYYS